MGVNGWVRWLETRGLYEPGEQTSTRTDWRNLAVVSVLWFLGAGLLLAFLVFAR
ncbi:hypothetical protein [Sciscionella sediminilitoris]|uniref:hypothetical protein n=1 Tax=Sciscionella sediminilitoris TaxID=1445613 RepID=UPI0012E31709|nr:hypothetical protein [Sciscionella sp. SE31]